MPSQPRFHDTGRGTFFSVLPYERVLLRPTNHFLAVLKRLIAREAAGEQLLRMYKGKRRLVRSDGKGTMQEITRKGYKLHAAHITRGNAADNKAFPALRKHDRELGLPAHAYGEDKAYDDTDIYERYRYLGPSGRIRSRRCWRWGRGHSAPGERETRPIRPM